MDAIADCRSSSCSVSGGFRHKSALLLKVNSKISIRLRELDRRWLCRFTVCGWWKDQPTTVERDGSLTFLVRLPVYVQASEQVCDSRAGGINLLGS